MSFLSGNCALINCTDGLNCSKQECSCRLLLEPDVGSTYVRHVRAIYRELGKELSHRTNTGAASACLWTKAT